MTEKEIKDILEKYQQRCDNMREILFKGKRKDNDEWVYGYYIKSHYYEGGITHFIVDMENKYDDYDRFSPQYEIDLDTVCQYTSLTDRNGKKIFENDIIRTRYLWHTIVGRVRYQDIGCYWIEVSKQERHLLLSCDAKHLEVIGNIFDNSELIRGVEK